MIDPAAESLCEHGRYRLLVTGDEEPIVRLSDARLEPRSLRSTPEGCVADYALDIDFYAGVADLLVVSASESETVSLDVAPAKGKLGRAAHATLLSELEDWAEGIIFGSTAATREVGDDLEAEPQPLARYARLRSRMDQVEAAFAAIRSAPHRSMVSEREERMLHRVRRADRGTIRSVLRRPDVRMALRGESSRTATVDHPRREETLDTPANRHLKSMLLRLEVLASDLAGAFGQEADASGWGGETAEIKARARHRAAECERWSAGLRRMRNSAFLRRIRPRAGGSGALLAVSWHPAYRRLDGLARSITTPRLALGGSGEALPLRRTYDLYELWSLAALERSIREVLPGLQWRVGRPFVEGALRLEVGSGIVAHAPLPDHSVLELWFQPKFRSYAPGSDETGRCSISAELRPDFAIRLRTVEGRTRRFLVLDAKYRSSRPALHDALRSAHLYRDAVRWDGCRAEGVYLLCPALGEGAELYGNGVYRQKFGIGAIVLGPDQVVQELPQVVERWIGSALAQAKEKQ